MMKFYDYYRFGQAYWFNGIYKISSYHYHSGKKVPVYYQVYKPIQETNWGDYLYRHLQEDKQLSFDECVALAERHRKHNHASLQDLAMAERVIKAMYANPMGHDLAVTLSNK